MAKHDKKLKALSLRRKGLSLKEIAVSLGISKGTVSVWCRDIELTKDQRLAIEVKHFKNRAKGRLIGTLINKQKRVDSIKKFQDDGTKAIGRLSKKDLLLIGTSLYWAEGAKTSSRFVFVNSSPDMIKLMFNFLRATLGVKKEDIKIGIQINNIHEYRISQVLEFWSKLLHLPPSQFDRPYYVHVKPKKVYENMDKYYGIVRLKVRKSANLFYRISGLINALIKQTSNLSR